MRRRVLIPLGVILLFGLIAVTVFISYTSFDNTLQVTVRDAVNKQWVWDTSITIQDRVINCYYQSDQGPVPQTFTHLRRGESQLTVTAPSYETVTVPVTIGRGATVIEEPIEIEGYEIPGLTRFIIFEKVEGGDLAMELHLVGEDGKAIAQHPCVDLWIGCVVSEQLIDGTYVTEPVDSGSTRGKTLYMGEVDWSYDTEPGTIFRYTGHLPGKQMEPTEASFLVIDYLLIVPDARKISKEEVEQLVAEGSEKAGLESLEEHLLKEDERIDVYMFTSWNVERP